ncbi:MAG: hypothetical protein V3S46_08220 [Nitrospinota bacterium]
MSKKKSVSKKEGNGLTAEESGKVLMALQSAHESSAKETSINLRVSIAKKNEIRELAKTIGVSASNLLLTAFFEYKNRIFGPEPQKPVTGKKVSSRARKKQTA